MNNWIKKNPRATGATLGSKCTINDVIVVFENGLLIKAHGAIIVKFSA